AGVPVQEAVVIGDNLKTDIGAAIRLGSRSVLMLTGVTSQAELDAAPDSARPTRVAHDATELESALDDLANL
ncbi:MAG TPA: HAD hydrolase-like protein, partial [Candidatus Limnocylindrales bacterium]